MLKWMSTFDEYLATTGVSALFTLSHEGELRLDVERTRDFIRENPKCVLEQEEDVKWNHCIALDHETQWPQYLLITNDGLCQHPRFHVVCCPDYDSALSLLEEHRQVLFEKHRDSGQG
jgi:hypothetical protein